LPPGCPHASEYPHDVLASLQDAAWAEMIGLDPMGLTDKARLDTCGACRLHPFDLERLRRAERPAPAAPARAPSPRPVNVRLIRGPAHARR
jgi:hypothetical protein